MIVNRHNTPVDLCAGHAVADGGVNGIGEVDNGRAYGQVYNIALGSEHKHLFGDEVALYRSDDILDILGIALTLEHLANPREALIEVAARGAAAELILPVRGDTVFSRLMHFPGSYLNLEWYSLFADNGGMQGLIHIRLRGRDIIFEAVRDWAEHIVDNAEAVIAIDNRLDYYSDGVDIINLIKGLASDIHFAVDSVDALDSALDLAAGDERIDALLYFLDYAVEELLARCALRVEIVLDLFIRDGVEADNGSVLKLLFYRSDT